MELFPASSKSVLRQRLTLRVQKAVEGNRKIERPRFARAQPHDQHPIRSRAKYFAPVVDPTRGKRDLGDARIQVQFAPVISRLVQSREF